MLKSFFPQDFLNCFVPDISYISGIKKNLNQDLFITINLFYGISFDVCLISYEEGRALRHFIIDKLKLFYGSENIIFTFGLNSDLIVLNAIDYITPLFIKDGRAVFSIIIKNCHKPLHVVDINLIEAEQKHNHIQASIEYLRRCPFTEFKKLRKVSTG